MPDCATCKHKTRLDSIVDEHTKALQASNDELRQFTYAASHDLREPLAKIKAFGQRLESKYADVLNGQGLNYLHVMQDSADRMLALIDDLLKYGRVDRDGTFTEVDLSETFREAFAVFPPERTEGVTLIVSLPDTPLFGDPHQLTILAQNLLSNSLKYRSNDIPCIIQVSGRIEDGTFIVWVRDNGIGFDPEYADRIFQLFERLHTRFEYPGTGIGLALCKKIVERHSGTIRAEGNIGQGSIFEIMFPVVALHE